MTDQTFTMYTPFIKTEERPDGTLMVYGTATHEVVDSSGEIMDYASSAPLFQRRSAENMERSAGLNMMPLRSMHQNIAAGKVVQFDYKDAEKKIDVGALVVDPIEISKVRNGVYTGFSIGGKYARRWPDAGHVRFTADPREVSLVDAPSVPTAKLTLFKIDGDIEKGDIEGHEFHGNQYTATGGGGIEPLNVGTQVLTDSGEQGSVSHVHEGQGEYAHQYRVVSNTKTAEGYTQHLENGHYIPHNRLSPTSDNVPARFVSFDQNAQGQGTERRAVNKVTVPEWVGEFKQAVEEMKKIKQVEDNKQKDLLMKSKTTGENVGIAYREGSPLNAPNNSNASDTEYGDPANFAFPVYKEGLCKISVDYFNNKTDMEKYSLREWHVLGRRLTMSVSQFGKYKYDPTQLKIIQEDITMSDELNKLDVGSVVSALKAASAQSAALAMTNPNAALANILGMIDSLSTGLPVTGQNVPVINPSVAMGKAVAAGTTPSATAATEGDEESTAETESAPVKKAIPPQFKAKAKAKAAEAATAPTSEDEETEEESTEAATPVYKKLDDKINALEASINQLVETLTKRAQVAPQVPAADGPVGALNAMVKTGASDGLEGLSDMEANIIKELDLGGPYALLKALKVAGADDNDIGGPMAYQAVNNAIRKATYLSLDRGGVITASRYVGRTFNPS